MMSKFLTKENIIIVVVVFWALIQSNYFATKLDLANVKLEMSEMKIELQKYSDDNDKEIIQNIENKFNVIANKLDRLK